MMRQSSVWIMADFSVNPVKQGCNNPVTCIVTPLKHQSWRVADRYGSEEPLYKASIRTPICLFTCSLFQILCSILSMSIKMVSQITAECFLFFNHFIKPCTWKENPLPNCFLSNTFYYCPSLNIFSSCSQRFHKVVSFSVEVNFVEQFHGCAGKYDVIRSLFF